MGKHIIRVSRWSWRSLLSAYSKAITLVFALFCAATGQISKKTAAHGVAESPTIFRGTAYRASDSSALSNIRLYLQECYAPDYGIAPEYGIAPWNGVLYRRSQDGESVVTDANGNFEYELSGSGDLSRTIISEEVDEGAAGWNQYYSRGCIYIEEGTDSVYTLYMNGYTTSTQMKPAQSKRHTVLTTRQGKTITIQIPGYESQKMSASIVNGRGQIIQTLSATADGSLKWNTHATAHGIYFLRVSGKSKVPDIKIVVR